MWIFFLFRVPLDIIVSVPSFSILYIVILKNANAARDVEVVVDSNEEGNNEEGNGEGKKTE